MMPEKKSLDEIMKEGFKEYGELGFGRKCVIYFKGKEQILYDELDQRIIIRTNYENSKYKEKYETTPNTNK